jgi:hypothetical protein
MMLAHRTKTRAIVGGSVLPLDPQLGILAGSEAGGGMKAGAANPGPHQLTVLGKRGRSRGALLTRRRDLDQPPPAWGKVRVCLEV